VNRNRSYADLGRPEASALEDYIIYEFVSIDPSYLRLYDIKLLAGRNLTMQDSIGNVLINTALAKSLQLGAPEECVGKELKISDGRKITVVGVIEDYYGNSLKEQVDNVVMLIDPSAYATLNVKLNASDDAGSLSDAVKGVERIWSSAFPEFLFSYQFLDENIDAFYKQEQKYAKLFQMFSIIFLLVGCLGLYGLITFLVNRKSKEVAIRKVLGATLANILVLFSKDYLKLILLAFVFAAPVSWYFADSWLNSFANHIELSWWLFTIPGLIVLLITFAVVSTKTFRAAHSNPVDKLKYE
jgi:putative ABC transport system permease protein